MRGANSRKGNALNTRDGREQDTFKVFKRECSPGEQSVSEMVALCELEYWAEFRSWSQVYHYNSFGFYSRKGNIFKSFSFFNRKVLFDHICIFRRSLYVPSGEKTRWDQGGDQNQVRYSFQ